MTLFTRERDTTDQLMMAVLTIFKVVYVNSGSANKLAYAIYAPNQVMQVRVLKQFFEYVASNPRIELAWPLTLLSPISVDEGCF